MGFTFDYEIIYSSRKTLALQMGGDIRVLDAEAGGTRFAVTLPKKS